MKIKPILSFAINCLLTSISAFAFFSGISLLFNNYEKTAYENASEYAEASAPYKSLLFEYTPNASIRNESKLSEMKSRINTFDSGSQFYDYSNIFGATKQIDFTFEDKTLSYRYADLSYIDYNPVKSTSLLELASGSKRFDEAFFETKDLFSLTATRIDANINNSYQVFAYLGANPMDKGLVTWESVDSSIASIDKNGNVTALKLGTTTIKATYQNQIISFDVEVFDSNAEVDGIINYIPVVIPTSFISAVGQEKETIIGSTFTANLNNKIYYFKIGGFYENTTELAVYRNAFIYNNLGEFIYFPRSERYSLPINNYYVWIGPDAAKNTAVYGEVQLLKNICHMSFSVPDSFPTNQVTINGKTFNQKLAGATKSPQLIVISISLIILSVSLFGIRGMIAKDGYSKKYRFLIIYIFGIIIPMVCLYFVKTVSLVGVKVALLTPLAGWIVIAIAIILSIIMAYQYVSSNKKIHKQECDLRESIPVLCGNKNCIYIAKGANLPDQNASALRVDSIVEALIDEGYAFHVIGQGHAPKGDIIRINDNYYIHSSYDKTPGARNSVINKIVSLYFPSDFIYSRVEDILQSNKIDYLFIYQTIPSSLMRRLIKLCKEKDIKIVFDIVEYQIISQQKKLSGVLFNYLPSKKIIEKYTNKGKVIAISTYLQKLFEDRNVSSICVPFFFNTNKISNIGYSEHKNIRLIYAGAPFGNRDTIGNIIKGFNLLNDKEKSNFRFSFFGTTRDDMKKLGVTETELNDTDKYVTYFGRQSHNRVLEEYESANYSLLLKPSSARFSKAGFPTKISESWALSTPVIANISGDVGMFLEDGYNGIISNSDSPEDFAEALRRVLSVNEREYLKMRKNSRDTAVNKLSKKVYSKVIKEFIEDETHE